MRIAIASIESPAPRAQWIRLLADDTDALLEQGPLWVDALAAANRWADCSRLYRFSDGREFVLPLVRRHAHRYAPVSGFSPSWGIGGVVGPGLDAEIVDAICRDLSDMPAAWIHLRPNPIQGKIWTSAAPSNVQVLQRRAHVVDLQGTPEDVFDRFSSSGRRNVRRAIKLGVETKSFTGGTGLDTYYHELFLPSVARWARHQNEPLPLAKLRATRRDPLSKLHALGTALGDRFQLTMAYVDGRVAAGNIVLEGPNAHYTRGAMNSLAEKTDAVYLGLWQAIKRANNRGYRWFHMGESGNNQSISSYKERFGAKPYIYNEYRYERVPMLAMDQWTRSAVKVVVGFKDASAN